MINCYKLRNLFFIAVMVTVAGCAKEHVASADNDKAPDDRDSINVKIKEAGRDPYVTEKDGFYYYMNTNRNYLELYRLKDMIYLSNAYSKTIYVPEAGMPYASGVSKAEIHFLAGKWYVYYSANAGGLKDGRIYVIENESADPLAGNWVMKGKIADTANDLFASDGTVFEYNGQQYFLWSGIKSTPMPVLTAQQQIYIAKMSNPWTLEGSRVMIAEPQNLWETAKIPVIVDSREYLVDYQVNQNPQVIKNPQGNLFVTFTASICQSDNLSLGLLSLKNGGDPLNAADWTKSPQPVFATSTTNRVYAPGFNGFFKSPNGTEDWLIYDANSSPQQGCGETRTPRIQKITWDGDGKPVFGVPARSDTITTVRPAR